MLQSDKFAMIVLSLLKLAKRLSLNANLSRSVPYPMHSDCRLRFPFLALEEYKWLKSAWRSTTVEALMLGVKIHFKRFAAAILMFVSFTVKYAA